jgi:hypothetical protein
MQKKKPSFQVIPNCGIGGLELERIQRSGCGTKLERCCAVQLLRPLQAPLFR